MTRYEIGRIDWDAVAANARLKGGAPAPAHLQAFIRKMGPAIERYAPAAGLSINIVLAQLAHEAGMMHPGKQFNAFEGQQDPLTVRAENYAGLKGMPDDPMWGGPTVSHLTYEYNGGRHVVQHPFRDYIELHKQLKQQHPDVAIPPPHELFVRDYIAKLLHHTHGRNGPPRYNGVFGVSDPLEFARALKAGGYYTADAGTYGDALAANAEALMPGFTAPLPTNAEALARARTLFPAHTTELGLRRLIAPELGRAPAIPGRGVVDAGAAPRATEEARPTAIVPLDRAAVRPGFLARKPGSTEFALSDQQFLALYNTVRTRALNKAAEIAAKGITTIKVGGEDKPFNIDTIMPARTAADLPTDPDAALAMRTEMTDRMLDVMEPLVKAGILPNPLAAAATAPARTATRAPFDRDKTRATYEAMTPEMLSAAYEVLRQKAEAARTTTQLARRDPGAGAPSEADRKQMIDDMVKASEELHTKGEIAPAGPESADRTTPGRPQPAADESPDARRRREEREGYERAMNALTSGGFDGDTIALMFLFALALAGGNPAAQARIASLFDQFINSSRSPRGGPRWDGGSSNGSTVPGSRRTRVRRNDDGSPGAVTTEDAVSPTNFKKLILPQLDEDTAALVAAGRVSPSFSEERNIGGPIIILDPGHFPNETAPNKGAAGSGTTEWREAVAMTRIQKMKLEALGFHVIVTKRDDGSNAIVNGVQVAGGNLDSRAPTITAAINAYGADRVIGFISNHFDGGSATARHGMIIARNRDAGTGNDLIAQYLLGAGYKPSPAMKVGVDVGGGRLTGINGVGVLDPTFPDKSRTFQILIEHAFIQNTEVMRDFLANRNTYGNAFAQAIAAFAIEKGYQLPAPLIDALRREEAERARIEADRIARGEPAAPAATVVAAPAGTITPEMITALRGMKDGRGQPIYTENRDSPHTAMLDARGNFIGGNMSFARADGMSIAKYHALATIMYAASTVGIDGKPKPALISAEAMRGLLANREFMNNLTLGITNSNNQTIQRAAIAAVLAANPGMSEQEAGKTFATWMNDTAKAFGMMGTNFSSAYLTEANATGWAGPVGWNDGNGDPNRGTQYTTAYDQARLGFVSRQFVESIRASNPALAGMLDLANQSRNTTGGSGFISAAGLSPADFYGKTGTGEGDFGRFTEKRAGSATAYMAVHRTLGYSIAVLEAVSGERSAAVARALGLAQSGTGVSLEELRKKFEAEAAARVAAAAPTGEEQIRAHAARIAGLPYHPYHQPDAATLLRLPAAATIPADGAIPQSTILQVIARHNPAISNLEALKRYATEAGIPLDRPMNYVEYMRLITSGLPLDKRLSASQGPLAFFNMAGVPKTPGGNTVDLGCAGTIATALMASYPAIAHAWQNNAILRSAGLTDYHRSEIAKYGMPVDVNVLFHTFKELGVLQVNAGGTAAMGREITFDSLKVGSIIGFASNEAAMREPGGSHAAMVIDEGTEDGRRYKVIASGNYSVDGSGATIQHRGAGFYTYKLFEPAAGQPLLEVPGQGRTARPILWASDPARMQAYHLAYMKARAEEAARVANVPAATTGRKSTTQVALDDRNWIELISMADGERHPRLTHEVGGVLEQTGAGGHVKIDPAAGTLEISLGKYEAAAGTEGAELAQLTRARVHSGLISILKAAQELGHLKLQDTPPIPGPRPEKGDLTPYLTDTEVFLEANAEALKALATNGFVADGRIDFLKLAAAGINVEARPGETLPGPAAISSARPIAPIASIEAGAARLRELGWSAADIEKWKAAQQRTAAPVAAVARPAGWKPTFIAFGDSLALGMANSSGTVRSGNVVSGPLAINNPDTARGGAGFKNGWITDMLRDMKHPIAPVTNAAYPETIGLLVLGYNDVNRKDNYGAQQFGTDLRKYVSDLGAKGVAPVLYELHSHGRYSTPERIAEFNAQIEAVAREFSLPFVKINTVVRQPDAVDIHGHLSPADYTLIGDLGMETGRKHNFTEFFRKTKPEVVREVPVAAATDDIYARMRKAQTEAAAIIAASMTMGRERNLADAVPYTNDVRPPDYSNVLWNPETRTLVGRDVDGSRTRTPSVKAGIIGSENEENSLIGRTRTRHQYVNGIQGRPPSLDNIAEFIRTARIDGKPIDGRPPVIPASLHRFATSGFDDPNKNGWIMFSKPMAYGMNGSHAWHVGIKGAYNIYTGQYKYDYYVSGGSDKAAGTELSPDGPAAGLEYRFYRSTAPEDRYINGVNYVGTVIPITSETPQGYIGRRLGPIFGASVDFVTMNGTNGKMIHKVIGFGTEGCQMMRSNQDYTMFLVNHGLNIMGTREFNFDLDAPTEADPRRYEGPRLPKVMPATPVADTDRGPRVAASTTVRHLPEAITPARALPTRFFFYSGQETYTRADVDRLMRDHGPNILIGNHHIGQDHSVLAYAREKGAWIGWYMLGKGEPATGYNNDGRVRYGSDQSQIRGHIDEMNALLARYKQNASAFHPDTQRVLTQMGERPMTRATWDSGGWLLWHKIKLLEARDEEALALAERRTPRLVLPDAAEFDSLNNGPVEVVADQIADFSRWRLEVGIRTRLLPKNLEHQHLAPIDARVADGRINMDVFAPIHILEEYASAAHVRIITEWATRHRHTVVQTINTDDYRSPASGFVLPANLDWGRAPEVASVPDVSRSVAKAHALATAITSEVRETPVARFVDPKDNRRFSFAILDPATAQVLEGNNVDRTTQTYSFAKARTAQVIFQLIKEGKLDGQAFFAQHGQTMANMLQYGSGYSQAAYTLADAAIRMSRGVMTPADRGDSMAAFMRLMNDRNITLANGTTVTLSQHTRFTDPSAEGISTVRDMALISLALSQHQELAAKYAGVAHSRYPDQAFAFRGPGKGTGKIGAFGNVFLWGGATEDGMPYAVAHTDNVQDLSRFVQQTHDRARGLARARVSEVEPAITDPRRPIIRLAAGRELPRLPGVTIVEPAVDDKPADPYSAAVMHLAMLTSMNREQLELMERRRQLQGGSLVSTLYYPGSDQPALPNGLTTGSIEVARAVATAVVPEGVKDKVIATATAEQATEADRVVAGTHTAAVDDKKDKKDKGGEGQTAAV